MSQRDPAWLQMEAAAVMAAAAVMMRGHEAVLDTFDRRQRQGRLMEAWPLKGRPPQPIHCLGAEPLICLTGGPIHCPGS